MYSFKEEKLVYIGRRPMTKVTSSEYFTVFCSEGVLLALNMITLKAYFLVDSRTSARMTFLIRKDNIYLNTEEPCYYA